MQKYTMGRLGVCFLVCLTFLASLAATSLIQRSNAGSPDVASVFSCTPIPISIGGSTNGNLETGDCVDTNTALYDGYTFSGITGEPLDIRLVSETFAPSLRLVQGNYPGGAVIATGVDVGNGSRRISAITLPSAGTYTIVASSQMAGITGGYTLTLETTNPRVENIQRLSADPSPTGSTVGFGVTFTSPVTGVDPSDFALTTSGVSGAAITNVAGTDSVYTVSVNSGSGAGTIRLDVVDNDTVVNGAGIPLGGIGLGNGSFTGPSYTIVSGTPTPTPTPSQNVVVTSTADSGPGSLRQSIADVTNGGTVTFSSVFSTPQTIVLTSGELRILKDINILGPGPGLLTVSGNNVSRVFNIGQSSPGHSVTISGLTVAAGRAPDNDFGGGLEQNFGTLTLSNCDFTGNNATADSAGFGGAIDFFDGTLNIIGSRISGNSSATNGGGIAVANTLLTISNSSVTGNSSGGGGGLHVFGGAASIIGSTFSANTVTNRGGAIFVQNGGLSIDISTFSGNSGAAASEAIAGFLAFESTSGARTAQITNTTIAYNVATPNEVGAILAVARSNSGAAVTGILRNSLLASNSEPAMQSFATSGASSTISSQGFNLTTSSGNGFLSQTSDRLNAEAGLAPLANNGGITQPHRLLAESAAIDAGKSFATATDQRGSGFPRIVDLTAANAADGDGADIGSYELQSEPPPPIASVSGRVTTPTGQGLRNAIVAITDPQGIRRTATTSSFGIYTFTNIPTGFNYIFGVSSKRYRFSPQSLTVNGNLGNVDFTGLE